MMNDKKIERTKKMMLWFAMGSVVMFFAGLTSAYVVSSSRPDWLQGYHLPKAFYLSTVCIVLSSLTYEGVQRAIKRSLRGKATGLLATTFLLGIAFVIFQFSGFSIFISEGYFFTGTQSNITISFIYALVIAHLTHLALGLISLTVVCYNHWKKEYTSSNILGLNLSLQFWHFLGVLWIYLLLFFHFAG